MSDIIIPLKQNINAKGPFRNPRGLAPFLHNGDVEAGPENFSYVHTSPLAEQGLELRSWFLSLHSSPNITSPMGFTQLWIGYNQRPSSVTRLITFSHVDLWA